MSSLPADLVIWGLLVTGTVFSGLGLMGLLLFPDTRSRMFTAFRATAIGLGAFVLAVTVYGYTLFTATGDDQYAALVLRTLVLAGVLAIGTWVMYGTIRKSTQQERPAGAGRQPDSSGADKNGGN